MSLFLNVEMLTRSAPHDERRRGWKQLERIRRGVTQMQRMIEDLLDVGSIESGRLAIDSREHEIGELFQDAVELSAPLIHDKRIEIKIETPPAPFKVRCDRERMMQVFSNLIGNAVKFVPERGTIVLSAAASGASALVAVRDTGPGIPPARIPHLFQRYWQADETARKGRGLGLFITKGIVEAQGGVIWAESQVGTGSTFFITLPLITPITRRELVVEGGKRPARRAPPRLNNSTRTRIRAND
jgi:signal transduction histidine kinase